VSDDERSLDPPDWGPLRATGQEMVEVLLRWLEDVRNQPAWTPMPEEVKARFRAPLPMEGEGVEAVWSELRRSVLPYRLGNVHRRFWARVMGSGTPSGALGQLAAAVLNDNLSGLESSAVHVEAQGLRWVKELMGFPDGASGVLTSGCSMANLVALQVARDAAVSVDVNVEGVQALPRRLVAYASDEVHSSLARAFVVLGLGAAALRRIPVDASFQVQVGAMARAIAADRAQGSSRSASWAARER
jgi:glutamate/tyrosine decarboxylase-like PLP-dependent enzyme